jgi:hypothetical protein
MDSVSCQIWFPIFAQRQTQDRRTVVSRPSLLLPHSSFMCGPTSLNFQLSICLGIVVGDYSIGCAVCGVSFGFVRVVPLVYPVIVTFTVTELCQEYFITVTDRPTYRTISMA